MISLQTNVTQKLQNAFPEEEYCLPPLEIINNEITQQGQFNLIHSESGLKIDFMVLKSTPHALTEFKRRSKVPFTEDFDAWLAAPEDVIIKKLACYGEGGSEKHLSDIRSIIAQTELDQNYLQSWIDELGLDVTWRKIR